MKLLVGLGNPGPQYAQTRHNVGFHVVDRLAAKHGWQWSERRGRAVLASGSFNGEKIVLAKPLTYMNLSGEAIGELVRWYKLPLEDLLIIYDELDLPVGKVRLRGKGSAAGHNGLGSVIQHLHTNEFPRLRVGIGRPTNKRIETINYVLGVPSGDERIQLEAGEEQAVEAIEMFLTRGLEAAMNAINIDPEAQRRAEEKRRRQLLRRLPIQVGMAARLFADNRRPAREEITFARTQGLQHLQFPGPEQGLDAALLGDSPEVVGRALEATHIGATMEILLHLNAAGVTASATRLHDALQANLPAINALRCAIVHIHVVPEESLSSEEKRALEEALVPQFRAAVALAEAQERPFRLAFEQNEPTRELLATPERCAALLEAVPGLGFVWDLNHTTREQIAGYLALTPRMLALHVSDTPLPQTNHHLPLGEGNIDFAAICRALLERDFRGPAILEIHGNPHFGGFGRDTDQALITSAERLREMILDGYMKSRSEDSNT